MKKKAKPAFRTLTTNELAQTTGGLGNSRLLHVTALKIIVAYLEQQQRHDAQAIGD